MESFEESLSGRFENMLSWAQLDALWDKVKASNKDWYITEIGMDVPDAALRGKELSAELKNLGKILRENHHYDYCGIVYADHPDAPTLIKVYGPKNLGASCGSSGSKVWPRWVLSLMPPTALGVVLGVALDERGKPKWWKKFSFKRN